MFCVFFSTNLTLGIRTKDLHSMVRSRKPAVVPIECPQPKTMAPTGPPNWKSQNRHCGDVMETRRRVPPHFARTRRHATLFRLWLLEMCSRHLHERSTTSKVIRSPIGLSVLLDGGGLLLITGRLYAGRGRRTVSPWLRLSHLVISRGHKTLHRRGPIEDYIYTAIVAVAVPYMHAVQVLMTINDRRSDRCQLSNQSSATSRAVMKRCAGQRATEMNMMMPPIYTVTTLCLKKVPTFELCNFVKS